MRPLVWVSTLLAVVSLSACTAPSAGPSAGPAPAGDAFVIAISSEFETLDPVKGYAPDGGSMMFDGLMSRDADLSLKPALATAPPVISADGLSAVFTLREGVKFHDGRPLTAKDVAYTYTAVKGSPIGGDYEAIDTVRAKDERTVEFRLKHAYAPLAQRTTLGIVPDGGIAANKPVGTGPYRFVSWTPGDKVVLAGNKDYWGGAPAISSVVVAFAADDNVRATRLAAGEFDAAILPPKAAARFENQQGVTVHKVDSADYRGIMWPFKEKVTGDKAVRKAVSLALDRQAMVDTIMAGAGKPAFGPISPDTAWHEPSVTGKATPDQAAATKLLDEAGYKPGPDGIRASFTLMYPAGDSLRKELALAVASDAKKIGLDVRLAGLDWDAIEPRMAKDALIMGYGSPYDPDYVNFELFHSKFAGQGFFNPGFYNNPKVDALLEKGRATTDEAARKQAYQEFQRLVFDDEAWTYLAFLKHVYVIRGEYQGVKPSVDAHEHATGGLFRDLHTWKPAA
ncbi:ABC transporter substrate-binding protein [Nonomuraea sp. NPDC059194]|uniref:ABC transporter substrate-binding protein n=1 Tax=Nonomuraea sp. NPDC059194 TaxID=3346764 RepID=UPI0036A2B702